MKRDESVTFRALPGDRRQAAAGVCDSSVPCHLKNFPAAADARLDSALPGPLRATAWYGQVSICMRDIACVDVGRLARMYACMHTYMHACTPARLYLCVQHLSVCPPHRYRQTNVYSAHTCPREARVSRRAPLSARTLSLMMRVVVPTPSPGNHHHACFSARYIRTRDRIRDPCPAPRIPACSSASALTPNPEPGTMGAVPCTLHHTPNVPRIHACSSASAAEIRRRAFLSNIVDTRSRAAWFSSGRVSVDRM